MPSLADLPVELFLDEIFNFLPVSDILNLGATKRFFCSLTDDEAFWHRRIQEDFNFSGSDTARATGWKFIYKRLSNPCLYVWGEKSMGRLGLADPPITNVHDGVPYPILLDIPGVRIVSLVAGGMSFHAIDSRGDIYVWGVLDGTSRALRSEGFSEPSKIAEQPMRLSLPVKFRSLSCGRLHTIGLDVASQVWTFLSWGRPFRLSSALLDKSSPETTPVQVESGWTFGSILTQSGDVLVYWPFGGSMKQVVQQKDEELDLPDNEQPQTSARAYPTREEPHVVPCYWWVLHGVDPVHLPPIPASSLPVLRSTGLTQEQLAEPTMLVKIAAFDNNLLGLTNKGHVLRYGSLYGEGSYQQGHWEYLPLFSDIHEFANLEAYASNEGSPDISLTPPQTMHITHISASFQTFFAYSTGASSVVLMGKGISEQVEVQDDPVAPAPAPHRDPLLNSFAPTIIPGLQNQDVISVVVGDYHYGALTGTGKLHTWGQFSKGALGLGDPVDLPFGQPGAFGNQQERNMAIHPRWGLLREPPNVISPTEVRFDHREKRKRPKYCFAAAALGWHTGALAIDLDPDQDDDGENEAMSMPGSFPDNSGQPNVPDQGAPSQEPSMVHILPFGRGTTPFRVGYAGRSLRRGGHHG